MKRNFVDRNKENLIHTSYNKRKIIEMITRLYIIVLKMDHQINENHTDVLFTLLENLFKVEDISWEIFVRQIQSKPIPEKEVLEFLRDNLINLDKIRILLSVIAMTYSDRVFSTSEITKILEYSAILQLENYGFMSIVDAMEKKSDKLAFVKGFRFKKYNKKSIFTDYLIIGSSEECNIRMKKSALFEATIVVIDNNVFIGTNIDSKCSIEGEELRPNCLYYVPENKNIIINGLAFKTLDFIKLYNNRLNTDLIEFRKSDYKFNVNVIKNRYSILVSKGVLFLNGHKISYNKKIELYYDDKIQIEGYQPFNLLHILRNRDSIGVQYFAPDEFFIAFKNGYLSVSTKNDAHTVTTIRKDENDFYIFPPKRGWNLFINNIKISKGSKFRLNSDVITLNKYSFRINNFFDLIEVPFEVEELQLLDIKHFFPDGSIGLDRISFTAKKGDMISILGKSGSGKSTLLKTLAAEIIPTYGSIEIDGKKFYQNLSFYSQYIGYVPQQDLLFSNLTVFENLYYRGRLRMPNISLTHLNQKINNILNQLKLSHRKNMLVGDVNNKILSGGERKRLNLALELLFEPTILICDEPTSGLSSADSEQIIEILKQLTDQGKIVIATIHQPSPTIFDRFDKVLIMDSNGKQVYFGNLDAAFEYFDIELEKTTVRKELLTKKRNSRLPEYFFDILNYPEYTKDGEIIYEQIDGNVFEKRKFNSVYWKDKYKRKTLYDLVNLKLDSNQPPVFDKVNKRKTKSKRKLKISSYAKQFVAFFTRNLKLRLRNNANLIITFLQTPILAFLIAFMLRLKLNGNDYSFYDNINAPIYIFISIIYFIFIGMSSSIEEIYSEKRMILREKFLNQKMSLMLISKSLVLMIFSVIQVIIYYLISSFVLGFQGNAFHSIVFFLFSSIIGFSIGLLISSLINNNKALINILPLILIPQIIFGGAIIQFERMNEQIKFDKHKIVPEIVEFIPSRWLFEGLFTSFAKRNKYDYSIYKFDKERLTIKEKYKKGRISNSVYKEKMISLNRQKAKIAKMLDVKKYRNDYIYLTTNLLDGSFLNSNKNVFLSSYKNLFGFRLQTFHFNLGIIFIYVIILESITLIILKYFYKE